MAGIENRSRDFRVVWRQGGAKQYETFTERGEAEQFVSMVEAHGERWPRGWVKGQGFTGPRSTAPTFAQWADRAIRSRSRANARTRFDYQRDVRIHLAPVFGELPIDTITREMVGNWLVDISRQREPKTVKNIHNLASSIIGDAVRAGLLTRNEFEGAVGSLPKVKHEEMVFLSRPEFDRLAAATVEDYRVLVRLLGLTGLRWSEATALSVGAVEIHKGRLHVVRAWKRTPESYFVLGEPKSNRSRRTISIPPSLAADLHPYVTGVDPGAFLFTSAQGRPVRHANFRQRVWLPAVAAAELHPRPRIHDLRHTHASLLINAGVSLVAIQRRLGHESIQTTIDRYGHLAPELDDQISAALEPGMLDE